MDSMYYFFSGELVAMSAIPGVLRALADWHQGERNAACLLVGNVQGANAHLTRARDLFDEADRIERETALAPPFNAHNGTYPFCGWRVIDNDAPPPPAPPLTLWTTDRRCPGPGWVAIYDCSADDCELARSK